MEMPHRWDMVGTWSGRSQILPKRLPNRVGNALGNALGNFTRNYLGLFVWAVRKSLGRYSAGAESGKLYFNTS